MMLKQNVLASTALALVLGCGLAAPAAAQDATAPADAASTTTMAPIDDQQFLMQAIPGGIAEVRFGELARDQGDSQEVRDFGEMMVRDHTPVNDQLTAIAGRMGVQAPQDMDAEHQQMYEQLSQLSGTEFDRMYLQGQVMDHQKTVALFAAKAGENDGDELTTLAANTLPTLQQHLEMVQQLASGAGVAAADDGDFFSTRAGAGFGALDIDRSGDVSMEEFTTGDDLPPLDDAIRGRLNEAFSQYDVDQNTLLSEQEFGQIGQGTVPVRVTAGGNEVAVVNVDPAQAVAAEAAEDASNNAILSSRFADRLGTGFADLDADRSGGVSIDEFAGPGMGDLTETDRPLFEQEFAQYDLNGDGVLTEDELTAMNAAVAPAGVGLAATTGVPATDLAAAGTAADGTTADGAGAEQCLADLQAYGTELRSQAGVSDRDLESLRNAAVTFARLGNEEACQTVLSQMRDLSTTRSEGFDETAYRTGLSERVAARMPVSQYPGMLSLDDLEDADVIGIDGEDLGDVANVIINPADGTVQYVLLSTGGWFDTDYVPVRFADLQVTPEGDELILPVSQEALDAAPTVDAETAFAADGTWGTDVGSWWDQTITDR